MFYANIYNPSSEILLWLKSKDSKGLFVFAINDSVKYSKSILFILRDLNLSIFIFDYWNENSIGFLGIEDSKEQFEIINYNLLVSIKLSLIILCTNLRSWKGVLIDK